MFFTAQIFQNAYGHENGNNGNAYGHENGNNGGGNDNGNNGGGNGGNGGNGDNGNGIEGLVYFYHPDHLGSSSYITDANGEVAQHLEYFAFGETFVEEHSNKDRTPYLYNAKELDEETGLYYYGARYYSPEVSVWLSVDELAEKYPNMSPYAYAANNPILFIDPDGRDWIVSKAVDKKTGRVTYNVTLKIAALNSSNSKIDMAKFNKAYKSQVQKSFSGSYKDSGNDVTVNTSVEIRTINSKANLAKDEHFLEIQNESDLPGVYGQVNKIYGKELYISDKYVPGMLDGSDNNTLPHETGHTGGLYHPDIQDKNAPSTILFKPGKNGEDKDNAMYSGGSGLLDDKTSTEINDSQFKVLIENIENKKVNEN